MSVGQVEQEGRDGTTLKPADHSPSQQRFLLPSPAAAGRAGCEPRAAVHTLHHQPWPSLHYLPFPSISSRNRHVVSHAMTWWCSYRNKAGEERKSKLHLASRPSSVIQGGGSCSRCHHSPFLPRCHALWDSYSCSLYANAQGPLQEASVMLCTRTWTSMWSPGAVTYTLPPAAPAPRIQESTKWQQAHLFWSTSHIIWIFPLSRFSRFFHFIICSFSIKSLDLT